MLIHPWDAALDEDEWRSWLADGRDFGQLIVNGLPGQPPAVVPTHFSRDDTPAGTQLLVHLARPNPVWANLDADPNVVLTVIDDYAYIPTTWRAKAGGADEDGVPTSYYATVQLRCLAEIVDDPAAKQTCSPASSPTSNRPVTTLRSPSMLRPTAGCCPVSAGCGCT